MRNFNFTKIGILGAFMAILFLFACTEPKTKDAYLSKYEAFVEGVQKNHEKYKKKDWKYADKRIKKYNTVYYKKFEDELSLKEQLKIGSLNLKYYSIKESGKFGKKYKKEVKKEIDKLKKDIKYYLKNEMDEDLDKLMEGAEEIGDSLGVVIEDLVDEIKKKI